MLILTCTDQLDAQFELKPGTRCSGFRENGVYLFAGLPPGASLYIDEALVESESTSGGTQLRWQPGFYAGEVSVEIVDASGELLATYRLDVGTDESKLGGGLFQQMLDSIHAYDPELIFGTESAQMSIGKNGDVASLLLQYARLRRYADDLVRSYRAICAKPLTRLRHQRQRTSLQRVRRIDVTSARRFVRQPGAASFLGKGPVLESHASPPAFDVMHGIEDGNNPANRALAAALALLRLRCTLVADALVRLPASVREDSARAPLTNRLGRKLIFVEAFSRQLASIAKLPPFSTIRRPTVDSAGLTAISAHPVYARAYRLAWASLRPGVEGPAIDESLWLSPTWEIYERWCFISVVMALRELYPQLKWTCQRRRRVDVIRHIGTGEGTRIEASLQRTFLSASRSVTGMRSVSLQLRPDIVVTAEVSGQRRMVVLDAKYRTSRRNVLAAMQSAHLYQDALRWDGRRPDCSLLLVPRGGGAPWLEEPAFHASNRTGVHVLSPEDGAEGLRVLLGRWLGVEA